MVAPSFDGATIPSSWWSRNIDWPESGTWTIG